MLLSLSFVPLAVGGCKQFTTCKRSGEPVRQARELSEGFNWNIPFKCRRLKPWVDFFPETIRRMEKQADSYFWGVDAQEIPGGKPEVWLALPSELCRMTLSRVEFLKNFSRGRSGGLVFPSLSEFSTVYCDPHSQRLWHSQSSRNRCFSGTLLLFPWSSSCWQFDLCFLCLF